jgi:hypothetical protein
MTPERLEDHTVICAHCQTPVPPDRLFCPTCGHHIQSAPKQNKTLAWVVLICVGLPAALCGSCSLMFAETDVFGLVLGIALWVLFGLTIYWVARKK